jgi:DNA-dependent protein kinase catalytic subunit
VVWGTQKLLPFTFPFPNDIELALDPLLPRITQLAQHSPDRKTKVAACELLYANWNYYDARISLISNMVSE